MSIALTVSLLIGNSYLDLLVYRMGAQVLLDGGDIYGALLPVVGDFEGGHVRGRPLGSTESRSGIRHRRGGLE